jgi:hypothetical protein
MNTATEWTTVNLEKPTANELRKSAIDHSEDIQTHATRVVREGLKAIRQKARSRAHETINA